MALLKLSPIYKGYIWGGQKLKSDFHKSGGDRVAESWELSCHADGKCTIAEGEYAGYTLEQYIAQKGNHILGRNFRGYERFPILVKLIDACDNLSIQVHPDNEYARMYENDSGKTEMWYILNCETDACLYMGFARDVTKHEFVASMINGEVESLVKKVPVKDGDCYLITPGTLHAIGKGIVLAEIQQSSNITYRIFDYGRLGTDGKPRELHTQKAAEIINLLPYKNSCAGGGDIICSCEYFEVRKLGIKKEVTYTANADSFVCLLFTDGFGEIRCSTISYSYHKGDCFFLEAESEPCLIIGSGTVLTTTIKRQAPAGKEGNS